MLDNELIIRFIDEIMEDYVKYGKNESIDEWFRNALKRHIIDITEEDIENIKKELMEGITAYREMQGKNLNISEIETNEIQDEIEILAENTINDIEEVQKLKDGENYEK